MHRRWKTQCLRTEEWTASWTFWVTSLELLKTHNNRYQSATKSKLSAFRSWTIQQVWFRHLWCRSPQTNQVALASTSLRCIGWIRGIPAWSLLKASETTKAKWSKWESWPRSDYLLHEIVLIQLAHSLATWATLKQTSLTKIVNKVLSAFTWAKRCRFRKKSLNSTKTNKTHISKQKNQSEKWEFGQPMIRNLWTTT